MIFSLKNFYVHYLSNPKICTDSRALIKGAIFFALKGDHFDGNKFALQAIELGCSMAVVDDIELKDFPQCYYVENVLGALQSLAKYHRDQIKIPTIGITGTNGKTTTKELVYAVLSKKFNTYATKGNFNNHIGVPLSILSISNDIEIAVIEMGANHIGEIAELCKIAKPSCGLITNIGIAHLEGFDNFEGVIKAKTELYHFLKTQEKAACFVHYEDELLMAHSADLSRYTYGISKTADVCFEETQTEMFASINWLLGKDNLNIQSKLIGNYNIPNIMAAISIGKYFGIPDLLIKEAIEEYSPLNQRSQLLETKYNRLIVDAYNANPSSMIKAIDNFISIKLDKKLFILGDMLELGTESHALHQKITDYLSKSRAENVLLIGPQFSRCYFNSNWKHFQSTDEALQFLSLNKITDHNILLKGSRGMMLEKLIDAL